MNRKTVVLGIAGSLAVAGGGAAIAANRSDSSQDERRAIVNDVAKQLGVEPSALTAAFKTALKNRVDAAVAAGRLTKEQGDELKARIDSGDAPFFGFGSGGHHGPFGHLGHLDAAASYLGLTEAQLRDALGAGKTLAQVAKDRGKSVEGLVEAMTAEAKEHLDAAVAAGRLTQEKADTVLRDVRERITDVVNGDAPSFRRGFRPHRFGGAGAFYGAPTF
jgi:polyhydroxyalkanoate synthesis regulator phasin